MGKRNKPNAGGENPTLEKEIENNCQRYKVKYNNTKLDGKFYNAGDIVESGKELSKNYFEKV